MTGEPLRQSKLSLEMAIKRLKSTDRFNLVFFDDSFWSYAINPVPATPSEKAKAIKVVQNIEARGGTQMYPAISYALSNFTHLTTAIKQLIFLTDGAVSGERALFSLIANSLDTARLFTIGIGSAPNSYFMSRAAEIGHGSHLHIGNTSEISDKMNVLFQKIENPAVTDLKLTLPKGFRAEHYPNPLPDLYVGDPISIALRGKKSTGLAMLEGKIGNQNWLVKIPLDQAAYHTGIAKVWARKKIANLERLRIAESTNYQAKDKIDAELLETALSYRLVSRLSSLVALDITPSRPLLANLTTTKLKTAIPYGWDRKQFEFLRQEILPPALQKTEAPFAKLYKANLETNSATFMLPQTALNWETNFMLALATLLFGMILLWVSRKYSHG
jgi:Ca-activated chloride channel family protein